MQWRQQKRPNGATHCARSAILHLSQRAAPTAARGSPRSRKVGGYLKPIYDRKSGTARSNDVTLAKIKFAGSHVMMKPETNTDTPRAVHVREDKQCICVPTHVRLHSRCGLSFAGMNAVELIYSSFDSVYGSDELSERSARFNFKHGEATSFHTKCRTLFPGVSVHPFPGCP